MAITNHDRVGKVLELLNSGLHPYVERELKASLGENWKDQIRSGLKDNRSLTTGKDEVHWDTSTLLQIMWDHWHDVFSKVLGHAERALVSELRVFRNRWAHQETFSSDDAHRAMDSAARLLSAISAPEASEVEKQRQELLRVKFDEQARHEKRKAAVLPLEGQPAVGLRPWRDVITPHPDVASGRYQQAEFAADLWQVYLKEGSDEYKDPVEFFRRTYLTEGLKQLLSRALLRLTGKGGDPVVELQTNFGGGKTHSLLALYHLFSGTSLTELPGIEPVLKAANGTKMSNTRRVVLVGNKIPPGQPQRKPDGTVVRTLWGELAWQLGGAEGYAILKEADQTSTNPGDLLRVLFKMYAPCLILIDEWVSYARQLCYVHDLPAGTFDAHFTFAQALSEAAKTEGVLLVVSIPSSDIEIGGEGGKAALDRLKNAIGRVESPWRPATAEESFEIVGRRLFQPMPADKYASRDAVARAYSDFYSQQSAEFPQVCREAEYERRIKASYPIHPELFDRLYNDWSTLDKFQRTRGVLRLMAAVIHTLWERQDSNLLIMPASVPIDDPSVQSELTRYLEDGWVPVIERDVDGPSALPLVIDRESPATFGRFSACRRVARTIYMGSAPHVTTSNRGLDDRYIKLGCAQPGETVATFGDALRRLADRATYLYLDGNRYWYSTQPTVSTLARDRAGQVLKDLDAIHEEIRKRLKEKQRERGDFIKVHPAPASSVDVPDEDRLRLVILGPEHSHVPKTEDSAARKAASDYLEHRGSDQRHYRNMLVFLAPEKNRLVELQQAVSEYMAWKSIEKQKEELNLDNFQSTQAKTRREQWDATVDQRISETFQWLLVPGIDSKGKDESATTVWSEIRVQGQDQLAKRASQKLRTQELIITEFAGTRLRMELDRIPLWQGDHVNTKQLWDYFARYLYLPRLRDIDVLHESIREGVKLLTWATDTFAYAEGWDETKNRYTGLGAGRVTTVVIDNRSLLVKPDVAMTQMVSEKKPVDTGGENEETGNGGGKEDGGKREGENGKEKEETKKPEAPVLRRFHGTVQLDVTRLGRDAGKVAEEVVQHISLLEGAKVSVTVEIQATIPKGATEQAVRTVTENCRTLKFTNYGFEES